MSIRRSPSGPGRHLRWKVSAMLLTLVATAAGVLLAGGPAQAEATTSDLLISNLSWLNLGVRQGSTSAGTDIIQWTATGRNDQNWYSFYYTGESPTVHRFENINSGLCMTTDGVAGHALTQQPCSSSNSRQAWIPSYVWWAAGYTLYNPATGLNMDVAGASYGAGAEIDAWYPNNQLNQVFSMPGDNRL
jgi:Ricin-type beta-trefoil lectin domain